MSRTNPLTLTIVHELPGRLRVRFSSSLNDPNALIEALQAHDGLFPVCYSPVSQTVLVRFSPGEIRREECLVRMALAFSLEHGCAAVRIQKKTGCGTLATAEALSAAVLLAAGLARGLGFRGGTQQLLETSAGALTGGAVLLHGLRELRCAGVFHPEVLSLFYLTAGLLRGRILHAAAFTWLTAFGRHIMEPGEMAVEIRPEQSGSAQGVSVSAVALPPPQAFLQILPAVIRLAHQAAQPLDDMLANLREISQHHDHVLDALGPWKRGIPVQFSGQKRAS